MIAVGVGAAIFRRFRWAFPVSVFAVLPLRVPVHLGGQTSHLLVPLYLVIAAALVSFAYRALAGERAAADDGRPGEEASTWSLGDWPAAVWLYRALAATLVLYAIQTAYSADVSNAIENASFFLVPFAVMLMLLGEVRWTDRILGGVLIAVAGMALVFAGVAFAEYAARDLLLSRGDLLQSNQLHLYFRVNSLFYDPNLFGRDLALTLVALGAYLAWARGTRLPIVAAIVSGILLGGARAQLLDHQLRRAARGPAGGRGAALERSMGARGRGCDPDLRRDLPAGQRNRPDGRRLGREQQHDDEWQG